MSREAKPWFYKQTGWWMAWIDHRKVKLAKGKANKKAAKERLDELRVQARKNPPPGTPQRVASVIEAYQEFEGRLLAPSTMATRFPYLQSFAEACGWKAVSECTPLDMRQWLNSHPEWKSDWTRAREIAGVSDDAKLYGTRHAFGTRAVLNNVPLKTLSELLGQRHHTHEFRGSLAHQGQRLAVGMGAPRTRGCPDWLSPKRLAEKARKPELLGVLGRGAPPDQAGSQHMWATREPLDGSTHGASLLLRCDWRLSWRPSFRPAGRCSPRDRRRTSARGGFPSCDRLGELASAAGGAGVKRYWWFSGWR
jgi:hypothetical protein